MFQKRKKFKDESTPEKRMVERWDQQVFFITKKFPQLENEITAIVKNHESTKGTSFIPSEEALKELADLCSGARSLS